jgi:lipoate-protein ligase A
LEFELFGLKTKFIDSGFCEQQFNMDYDLSLVSELDKGEYDAFFRIYAWKPYAISLGMNQSEDEINKDILEKDGYRLVRRPTGGRAVFHANELTYSYITKLDKYTKSKIYELIHIEFDKILNSMGIQSDFVKANADFQNIYKTSDSRSICFASSAKFEIEIKGRKLIGSAQRVIDNKLLQHGSIPIDNTHLEIVNYLNIQNKDKLKSLLANKSTSIGEQNPRIKKYKDFAKIIKNFYFN